MSAAQDSAPPRDSFPPHWKAGLFTIAAAFFLLLALTRPANYIDSFNYAKHIVDQAAGAAPRLNPFYDFGHLLWRPLGWLAWSPFKEPLRRIFSGDDILGAGAALIGLSLLGGLCGAVFLFFLTAASTRHTFAATTVTLAYLSSNAVLYYTPTGMSYIAGIAFQIAALWLLQRALARNRFRARDGLLAGLLLGLSVAIWFPYILAAGGVFFYALFAREAAPPLAPRARAAGLAGLAAGTVALVALTYGYVIVHEGFTSTSAIAAWISRSRYGKSPDHGLLRMFGGIPRGFFSLGEGSVAWKRLLFERRSLSLAAFLATGVWKVGLLYLVLASSLLAWTRSAYGRSLLPALAAIAIPLAIFAAFLFEATPPERYLAAFPLLFLGFAHILSNRSPSSPGWLALGSKWLVLGLFASMFAVNMDAFWRFHSEAGLEQARARLHEINLRLQPRDRVILLSYQDKLLTVLGREPFGDDAKTRYDFVVLLGSGSGSWKDRFAAQAREVWASGGRVFLSRRFLAAAPDPSWNWVEGDTPGVSWNDLPAFFQSFDLLPDSSPDGFFELPATETNLRLVKSK